MCGALVETGERACGRAVRDSASPWLSLWESCRRRRLRGEKRYAAFSALSVLALLGQIAPGNQLVTQDGCIDGKAELEVMISLGESEEYMLRRPDKEQITVSVSGASKNVIYYFIGWQIGESSEILPADTVLTAADILRYENNGVLPLNAV